MKSKKVENEKKENKNKKIINKKICILMLFVLIVVTFISVFVYKKLNASEEKNFEEIKTVQSISTLEDGTGYIFGAKNNITFEVKTKDKFEYSIVDEDGNEIETETVLNSDKDSKKILTINPPEGLYEEGKNYIITIKNGEFTNEELKDFSKVEFSTQRQAKQIAKINDNVKNVTSEEYKVKQKENGVYTLKTKSKLKENEIIFIDEKEAYKVISKDGDNYVLERPQLNELYSELDYYGTAKVILDDPKLNDEIKALIEPAVDKTFKDLLIEDVDAAEIKPKIVAEWSEDHEGYLVGIEVELKPGQNFINKKFLNSHSLTFKYEIIISAEASYDLTFLDSDVKFKLKVTHKPSADVTSDFIEAFESNLADNLSPSKIEKFLEKNYQREGRDSGDLKQEIATFNIPITTVPGLFVSVDFNTVLHASLKAHAELGITSTTEVTIGYTTKHGIYSSFKVKNSASANLYGEAEIRLGFSIEAGLSLAGILEIEGGVESGVYGKAGITITGDLSNEDVKSSMDLNIESGVYVRVYVEVTFIKIIQTEITIVDKEFPLYSANVNLYNYKPKIKYHTVKISVYSNCPSHCGGDWLCNAKTFKVPDGGNLKNILGYDATFIYKSTYEKTEQHILDQLACMGACPGQDDPLCETDWAKCNENMYACADACYEKYPEVPEWKDIPFDVTTKTSITKDMHLYYRADCSDPVGGLL